MGLKTFTVDYNTLATSKHCRLDQKYTSFTYVGKWTIFDSKYPQVPLSEFLEELPISKHKKGELDDDYLLVNISDQEQRSGYLDHLEKVSAIGSDKNDLCGSDIFVSKLGMPRGYIFLNSYKSENIIGSTELIPYRIKITALKVFLKYLLLHPKVLDAYSRLESGKTPSHRRVNPYEFLKIRIPLIPDLELEKVVSQVEAIERKIQDFKIRIKPEEVIINDVFNREFGFQIAKFSELKKIWHYNSCLSQFSNNRDIRQSVKFHRDAGYFVMQELRNLTNKKIKNFLKEPIVLGKGISPKEYDENGEYYYVSMANIKNWRFETTDSRLVSKKFSDKNMNKTVVKNDILLARSGEGSIGKVALIQDEELKGVFADFTMRIRLRNYNHRFAYYYFRTDYFQYLVEINKKGLGNNTNIFPSQIQELPLLDIPLKEQQEIVGEIKEELDEQREAKKEVRIQRKKIDQIIEKAISMP